MNSAFEYALKSGGLMREEDYPYTGTDRGACKFDKTKIAAKVANFSVVSLDEEQIAANLVKNGPLAGIPLSPILSQDSFASFLYQMAFKLPNFSQLISFSWIQWLSMPFSCRHMLEEYHAHTYARSVRITVSC